jgi:hypothetical protein
LGDVGAREDRIARNEALFRDVNERVRELANQLAAGPVAFVCECGQADCAESLPVLLADYERVRSEPTHFIVAPGHDLPEVERIVERNAGYHVVRKHAYEAAIAIDTDPRS